MYSNQICLKRKGLNYKNKRKGIRTQNLDNKHFIKEKRKLSFLIYALTVEYCLLEHFISLLIE